jgi:hypothetical protein
MDFNNLSRGVKSRPIKIALTGVEGVGKTTFAANAPAPIFADLEQGSATLDATRFPEIATWADLLGVVGYLYSEKHEFQTLVIDSMSVAERLANAHIAAENNVASIDEIGYGKGHGMVADQFDRFLRGMDALVNKGMNVILVCHSVIRRVDDPKTDSFDQFDVALNKKIAPKVKQWADTILFAEHDKSVVSKGEGFNKRTIAKSYGERIMWTEYRASHVAKNRFGLPEKMPLDWPAFAAAVESFYASTPEEK